MFFIHMQTRLKVLIKSRSKVAKKVSDLLTISNMGGSCSTTPPQLLPLILIYTHTLSPLHECAYAHVRIRGRNCGGVVEWEPPRWEISGKSETYLCACMYHLNLLACVKSCWKLPYSSVWSLACTMYLWMKPVTQQTNFPIFLWI